MSKIGKIADNDFATLELIDADDNEIARQAAQRLPIILPWGRQNVRLGTCYQSSLQHSKHQSPWLEETPFILSDLYMMPKILHRERGTNATYKSISTARECETGDHLSLGFGVGVGLPFLASVSVKGDYDRDVQKNQDVHCLNHSSKAYYLLTIVNSPKRCQSAPASEPQASNWNDPRG